MGTNWIGPYIIIESFRIGTYKICDSDGEELA